MKLVSRFVSLPFVPLLAFLPACGERSNGPEGGATSRILTLEVLEDKIRGGWAGQMVGVTYGAPTEFRYLQRIMEDPREWDPAELKGALNQDDLYVEMTFTEVMDREGLDATTEQYGEAFKDSRYNLWHANLAARRLLQRGVKAPMSGHPDNNLHANDIDFQIESDFIGLMCPGLPGAAQQFADRVGRVMNYGDGVYGGVFVSAMYAEAFFESDPRKVVEAGVAALPPESVYARVIRDVLKWSAENQDWKRTWQLIQDNWDRDDPCPDGALRPFNIDAALNGAYIALGLLYGAGDFDRTLDVSMRAGQDSDCNPSNAAGVLGVMLGYRKIPSKWVEHLPEIADEKFSYTNYSFNTITRSTVERAKLVVKREGGSVDEREIRVPRHAPAELPLEQFSPGRVMERIASGDARWSRKGNWERVSRGERTLVRSRAAGSEAAVKFEGTGAILVGTLRSDGGLLEVYLDGERVAITDAFTDSTPRAAEGLWGKFNLPPGLHTLRVVVKGEPYAGSEGAWVELEDLVVFAK
jgi:hypothetical protein